MKKILGLLLSALLLPAMGATSRAGLLDDLIHHIVGDNNTTPQQAPSHSSGAPIPADPGAATEADFSKIMKSWCVRTMLDPYNKTARPDPKVASFIQESIDQLSLVPGTLSVNELASKAANLELAGANDPLFDLLAGIVQSDPGDQKMLFDRAIAGFPGSAYSKFLQFTAAANLGKSLHALHTDASAQEAADQDSLRLLSSALQDAPFTPDEMPVLRGRLISGSATDLFSRHAKEVCDILDSSPHVEPWVANYFQGLRFIKEAWDARGSGWANTVTAQGWKTFADDIAFARARLVKSWELNPKDPGAATAMITVTMAESEEKETMRKWFDRAVVAQMDYNPAYKKLLYGLYPRWLGSHEEMLRFGLECMQNGRYDTSVPYQYVVAVLEISKDSDDKETIFRQPEVYKNLQAVLSSYLGAPKSPASPRFYHTLAAIFAYKNDQLDVARQHMEAIQFKPDTSKGLATLQDIPSMLQKLSTPAQ
ncbi:MAG: hypothetical protein WCD79_02520 [Chthoniobacteraceae bacterium]